MLQPSDVNTALRAGDSTLLFSSGETSPGVVCPALESPEEERHEPAGVGPE